MKSVSYRKRSCQQQEWIAVEMLVRRLLTTQAEEIAHETGFVQRRSPITGAAFVRALVLGWLHQPQASYTDLQQALSLQGIEVSPQAVAKRMTEQAVMFLQRVCEMVVGQALSGPSTPIPLLARFNGVYLQDGTVIGLPDALEEPWPGCGGRTPQGGRAGVRVQLRLDYRNGAVQGPWVQAARSSEKSGKATAQQTPLPPGALYVTDAGVQSLEEMRWLGEQGVWYLTGATLRAKLLDEHGRLWELPSLLAQRGGEWIDEPVRVGLREQVPCRLIALKRSEPVQEKPQGRAVRGKGSRHDVQVGRKKARKRKVKRLKPTPRSRKLVRDWVIMLTNVPADLLSASEARELMRARWQMELIWKLWKQHGQLDTWRSEKPMRILCEVFAKLIGLIIQHWLTIVGCWEEPHRSLVKAAHLVRTIAPVLLVSLQGPVTLLELLERTGATMRHCRLNPRRKHPNTSQRLLRFSG